MPGGVLEPRLICMTYSWKTSHRCFPTHLDPRASGSSGRHGIMSVPTNFGICRSAEVPPQTRMIPLSEVFKLERSSALRQFGTLGPVWFNAYRQPFAYTIIFLNKIYGKVLQDRQKQSWNIWAKTWPILLRFTRFMSRYRLAFPAISHEPQIDQNPCILCILAQNCVGLVRKRQSTSNERPGRSHYRACFCPKTAIFFKAVFGVVPWGSLAHIYIL